jgi:phage shock protein PspC (stress-responsive transcriptional regulator)
VNLQTRRTMPWAPIFRGLAERYGWSPDVIAGLTMYQALMYCGFRCPEDVTVQG